MLKALQRTVTEILDSKKAAYSFIAAAAASVLHLYFEVSVQDALLLVSPLGVATISQAHVDASAAKQPKAAASTTAESAAPSVVDAGPPTASVAGADGAAKTGG